MSKMTINEEIPFPVVLLVRGYGVQNQLVFLGGAVGKIKAGIYIEPGCFGQ